MADQEVRTPYDIRGVREPGMKCSMPPRGTYSCRCSRRPPTRQAIFACLGSLSLYMSRHRFACCRGLRRAIASAPAGSIGAG